MVQVGTELISYASQLSQTLFSAISQVHRDFVKVFPDSQMYSAFVMWAVELLDYFGPIYCRHIMAPDVDTSTRKQCVQVARQQCLVVSSVVVSDS